jgi:Co/Zn/Cd efflux system component
VLSVVLAANATMFVVELTAGFLARSNALTADSLDMLGDALAYGASLYVVGGTPVGKARAALLKGVIMMAFAFLTVGQAAYKLAFPAAPSAPVMGLMGLAALAVNAACLLLLLRHRSDDINMSSLWLCSRNDIIANLGVLGAAVAVAATGSQWPDVAVGLAIAALFLRSALGVMRGSLGVLTRGSPAASSG